MDTSLTAIQKRLWPVIARSEATWQSPRTQARSMRLPRYARNDGLLDDH